jgi:hypothetical protein
MDKYDTYEKCSHCAYEFCNRCFQCYKERKHSNQNDCYKRRIVLPFTYVLIIYSIIFKLLRIPLIHKAHNYLFEKTIVLGISAIYILSHAVWWYWYTSIRHIWSRNKSAALLSFLGLCICEILINHIWYTHLFFQYLYDVLILAAVIVELLAYPALMDRPFRLTGDDDNLKLLYFVGCFLALLISIFSLLFSYQHTVYKLIVLMIPYDILSSLFYLNREWFSHWLTWVARFILLSASIYIIYEQRSKITGVISLLIMTSNLSLTYTQS